MVGGWRCDQSMRCDVDAISRCDAMRSVDAMRRSAAAIDRSNDRDRPINRSADQPIVSEANT